MSGCALRRRVRGWTAGGGATISGVWTPGVTSGWDAVSGRSGFLSRIAGVTVGRRYAGATSGCSFADSCACACGGDMACLSCTDVGPCAPACCATGIPCCRTGVTGSGAVSCDDAAGLGCCRAGDTACAVDGAVTGAAFGCAAVEAPPCAGWAACGVCSLGRTVCAVVVVPADVFHGGDTVCCRAGGTTGEAAVRPCWGGAAAAVDAAPCA